VGAGQMIKGFDEAVVGMKVGETKTIHIPAEKAYGAKRDDLIVRVPLNEAGDISGAKVGMQVVL
jgi:peptidyl-prolyl cis-trans isomerase